MTQVTVVVRLVRYVAAFVPDDTGEDAVALGRSLVTGTGDRRRAPHDRLPRGNPCFEPGSFDSGRHPRAREQLKVAL